jgi:hypothetical protein
MLSKKSRKSSRIHSNFGSSNLFCAQERKHHDTLEDIILRFKMIIEKVPSYAAGPIASVALSDDENRCGGVKASLGTPWQTHKPKSVQVCVAYRAPHSSSGIE